MEKWIFYWFAWLLFIMVYFFELGSKKRWIFSVIALLYIITANTYVTLAGTSILLPIFINIILGFLLFSYERKKLTTVFITISFIFCYCGLKIWELLNPLWIFVPVSVIWVVSGSIFLYLFLDPKPLERIGVWFISTSIGQLLFGLILIGYGFHVDIGDFGYMISIVLFLLLDQAFRRIRDLSTKIEQSIQNIKVKGFK